MDTPFFQQIVSRLINHLHDASLAHEYTWLLFEKVTGQPRIFLMTQDVPLTVADKDILNQWIALIVEKQFPLQYILGSVPFLDQEIIVQPPVLIPRPETEEWVAGLITQLKSHQDTPLTILDIGTGTGCIALALAHAYVHARVIATDIVPENLALAQKNALRNNISNVQFVQSNLFESVKEHAPFDLIVSNPPYIAWHEAQTLDPSVSCWEDPRALFAQQDGYEYIEAILQQAKKYVRSGPLTHSMLPQLALEIGYQQGKKTVALAEKNGYRTIQVWQDVGKRDRLVTARID